MDDLHVFLAENQFSKGIIDEAFLVLGLEVSWLTSDDGLTVLSWHKRLIEPASGWNVLCGLDSDLFVCNCVGHSEILLYL